jgi:hypothetical protein
MMAQEDTGDTNHRRRADTFDLVGECGATFSSAGRPNIPLAFDDGLVDLVKKANSTTHGRCCCISRATDLPDVDVPPTSSRERRRDALLGAKVVTVYPSAPAPVTRLTVRAAELLRACDVVVRPARVGRIRMVAVGRTSMR